MVVRRPAVAAVFYARLLTDLTSKLSASKLSAPESLARSWLYSYNNNNITVFFVPSELKKVRDKIQKTQKITVQVCL